MMKTPEQVDIEWLKESMKELKESNQHAFDKVFEKLDSLNSFKWRMMGAGTLIGIVAALAIDFLKR